MSSIATTRTWRVNTIFGAITVVAGLLATLLGGIAGDALRSRFTGSYFLVSAAGLLCGFPFFVLLLYVPFPAAWILMFLAVFCLFFNTGPSNTILANVTHPSVRATAFALNIFIIHALGDAVSPPVIGWLSDHYSMNTAFLFVSLMMVVGGLFWLFGAIPGEGHRRRQFQRRCITSSIPVPKSENHSPDCKVSSPRLERCSRTPA